MLVLLSAHGAFLLQQGSAFGARKGSQAVSLLQPFWRDGTEAAPPQHAQEPRGREYEDFFELAGGEENQATLCRVRCRVLFQQKDPEPEPQPKELS